MAESRAGAADGTDDVRPSLAEPASVSGTDAEQSVLAELIAAADGTGIEPSVLAESRATAGGTDDELSPGEHGGGRPGLGDAWFCSSPT